MLDLYLIRHGATVPNAKKRYPLPAEDSSLNDVGLRQATALTLPAGTVYSSPAVRCIQTATLAGYTDIQLVPALTEAHFGIMAGHTWAELETAYSSAPASWIEGLADPDSSLGPPEGETGAGFHARVAGWLSDLGNGTVLAFTHLGPVLAALRLTVGLKAAELPPCTVVHLRRSGADWWLVSLTPAES